MISIGAKKEMRIKLGDVIKSGIFKLPDPSDESLS